MAASPFPVTAHITHNDPKTGTAVFHGSGAPPSDSHGPMHYTYIYSTPPAPLPIALSAATDLAYHTAAAASKPLPMYPTAGGSVCAILDFAPNPTGGEGYMHRTQTIDYSFLMEGEMEMTLDGGEIRVVKKGEVIVQRGVNHAWRNMSKTEGARMAVVSIGCESVGEGKQEA